MQYSTSTFFITHLKNTSKILMMLYYVQEKKLFSIQDYKNIIKKNTLMLNILYVLLNKTKL